MAGEALIGRVDVLARIDQVLWNDGAACTLVGPPGSGRSSVLGAVADAVDPDTIVLRVAGEPAESTLPGAGADQLLRRARHHTDPRPHPPPASAIEPTPTDRMALATTLVATFERLAADRRLLVLVDDAHHWDDISLEALGFASRRVGPDTGIVAVSDPHSQLALAGQRVDLPPLSDTDLHDVARHRWPEAAVPVVAGAVRLAEGRPLALVELMSALDDRQRTGAEALPTLWPLTRRLASMTSGLTDLPNRTRRALVLVAAATTGDPTTVARGLAAADLAEADLSVAEELGLVALTTDGWTFDHPVLRLASLHDASAPLLRSTHALLAGVSDGTTRAWHRHLASTTPDPDLGDDLEAAARVAASDPDGHEASRLWTAAASHALDPLVRYARTEGAVEVLLATGQHARASSMIDELVDGAPDHAARARWQARHVEMQILHRSSETVAHRELVNLAAAFISGPDGQVTSDLLATAALVCDILCVERPHELVGMLGDDPETHGAMGVVADAIRGVPGSVDRLTGSWIDRIDPPLHVSDLGSLVLAGIAMVWLDHVTSCDRVVQRLRGIDSGAPGVESVAARLAAVCAVRRGDWHLADAELETAERAARRDELALILATVHLDQAQLAAWRGDHATAREKVDRAESVLPPLPWARFASGLVRATMDTNDGDYASAARRFAEAETMELRHPFGAPTLNYRFGEHVAVLLRIGDDAEAGRVIARYRSFTANYDSCTAAAALTQAEATLTGSAESFAAAADLFGSATNALDLARCRLAWGESLRRHRRRRAAVEQLEQAKDAFAAMGVQPLVDRADAELAACGVQRVAAPAAPELGVLTPREHEIVRLAATGLSNAGIAERLFVSDRTVGYHLQNAYRKLGVAGRHELASFFD